MLRRDTNVLHSKILHAVIKVDPGPRGIRSCMAVGGRRYVSNATHWMSEERRARMLTDKGVLICLYRRQQS